MLSSDIIVVSLSYRGEVAVVASQFPPAGFAQFVRNARTISGHLVFPANRIGGKVTINGARGFHPLIRDRGDLTLECIRRHYAGDDNPLAKTLTRYSAFFELFGDFAGYVDFFLLQER